MARRLARILNVVLAVATLVGLGAGLSPAPARADGDPASDVLLGLDVFYPYSPPVAAALQRTLNTETAAARTAHTPVKVAVIASPVDLGVIPDLFGKPQQYAKFLDQEISFRGKQPLLVVMSTGYGVAGLSARATARLSSAPKPAGKSTDALAQAALGAVTRLSGSSGSGQTNVLVIVLAVAAVLTGAALGAVRLRRRRRPG